MKKILLLATAAFAISASSQAQKAINIQERISEQLTSADGIPLNIEAEYVPTAPKKNSTNNAKDGEAEVVFLGTSGNIYTILLSGNNQVHYNPTLDAVSFIHRKNDAAPLNGVMEFDYSVDGGSSWQVNQGPLSPNFEDGTETGIGNGLRYPNGVLWAPEGSSDTDEAYIVGHGPALVTDITTWGNIFEVSSKLDGSNVSENYTNYADSIFDSPTDFHPYATSLVGDNVWSLSTQINPTEDVFNDTVSYQNFYLTKATFNEMTNSFDWEVKETFTPNYVRLIDDTDGSEDNFFQSYTMAWSPDGMVGYAVIVASEVSDLGYESVPKPIVWKSVDAGETWYKLDEFDFQTLDAMQDNLADAFGGEVVRPYFTETDAVVDNAGQLHLFSHVLSGFTNNTDSLGFIATGLETQFFYHVKTLSETEWDAEIISDVVNDDSVDAIAIGDQALRFKLQAARTEDGSKIFFSWHKAIGEADLRFADIFGRGYDIATDIYSWEKNLTDGSDYEQSTYYQTMSPIVKTGGELCEYELPIVFIELGVDDLDECQHVYLYGAGFDDINFDPTNVESISRDENIGVYPNPSNGYFHVSLPAKIEGDVEILDVLGKTVYQSTNQSGGLKVDLTEMPSGKYILRYVSGENVITESLVIR